MTLPLDTAVRVTLVLVLPLVGAAVLRKRSAVVRHWLLAVGLVCATAMPLLQVVTPRWGVSGPALQAMVPASAETWVSVTEPLPPAPAAPRLPSLAQLATWTWAAGVVVAMALLGAALVRLAWISTHGQPVIDRRWLTPLREIAAQLGMRRHVALLQSSHPSLLVTCGLWRPAIILPAPARDWADDRIRIVLCHELSHIRRGDWLLQVLGALLRAVYWFNPVVWIVCHRLRHESERACDDDVLGLGMSGQAYATELLDIARTLRPPVWSPAPGMARPSSLQRRVRAMLNTTIDRRPLSSTMRGAVAAAVLLLSVAVAGSGAAAQAAGAAFSGSFVDALNNAIPNVTMMLKNTQTGEQYTVRSDGDGRFTFDALPDGDYQGEVNALGFATIHPFFRIANGKSTQPDVIPLPLGRVEETITVTDQHGAGNGMVQTLAPERLATLRDKARTMALAPPLKIRDVRPLFPPSRSGVDATVFLEGVIDTNGNMRGLEVMQPADGEFARAALDAVREWQFEPTRLHGIPVDTSMHVTVRFLH